MQRPAERQVTLALLTEQLAAPVALYRTASEEEAAQASRAVAPTVRLAGGGAQEMDCGMARVTVKVTG